MANVVLGITGGIAAYKATAVIRLLTEAGHDVRVIPTANALRFIGATTLEALSHNSVDPDLYKDVADVKHVELGQTADLVIVAPATAAFLARYANGLADDLLLNTLLATKAPVLVAPAMHTEMWQHPTTIRNVSALRGDGVFVLEPAIGRLTGADSGQGRLPEPEVIVESALRMLAPQDLEGKRVLVTAGGTREPIDPARFIGNYSSGRQGVELARAAARRGATVTLIAANLADGQAAASIPGVHLIAASTAASMRGALEECRTFADVLIYAAAVADYRVATPTAAKLKKTDLGETMHLDLVQNPDLLAEACNDRRESQVIVGFAAETATGMQLLNLATEKLRRKGCDLMVANDVSAGAVFGSDDTSILVLDQSGIVAESTGSKAAAANVVLDAVIARL